MIKKRLVQVIEKIIRRGTPEHPYLTRLMRKVALLAKIKTVKLMEKIWMNFLRNRKNS